jgi:hypothetical protein
MWAYEQPERHLAASERHPAASEREGMDSTLAIRQEASSSHPARYAGVPAVAVSIPHTCTVSKHRYSLGIPPF